MAYKPDMMIYHANCADGFGAAWPVWLQQDVCDKQTGQRLFQISRWKNMKEYREDIELT